MAQLGYRVMDTQIFNLKLSVYATSAYILICSLTGDGVPATGEAVSARWNGSEEELAGALHELLVFRVLEKNDTPDGQAVYAPNPASLWRVPGQTN